MRLTLSTCLALCLCLSLGLAGAALAKPPLREVAKIDDGLMAIAIADEIRKTCQGIDARMLRALSTINDLRSDAKAMGYTRDEIDDYVTSKAEKKRMRAKASRFLASKGVEEGDRSALCAFAKREIKAGSAIGRLLR